MKETINALKEIEEFLPNILAAEIDYSSSDAQCGRIITQEEYDRRYAQAEKEQESPENYPFSRFPDKDKIRTQEEIDKHHCNLILHTDHTPEELKQFKKDMDFEYCPDFGTQELFGTIWLKNGDWMTRGEYDGSEWWNYHSLPELPKRETLKA